MKAHALPSFQAQVHQRKSTVSRTSLSEHRDYAPPPILPFSPPPVKVALLYKLTRSRQNLNQMSDWGWTAAVA